MRISALQHTTKRQSVKLFIDHLRDSAAAIRLLCAQWRFYGAKGQGEFRLVGIVQFFPNAHVLTYMMRETPAQIYQDLWFEETRGSHVALTT